MTTRYLIIAALIGIVGASTATFAAPAIHHVHHQRAANEGAPPLQPENAPPVSSAWTLPQGWPHTP